MSTSVTERYDEIKKSTLIYLIASVICALFGAVYEVYSHGVYSFHMIYAFAYPLLGGVLPLFIMLYCNIKSLPGHFACSIWSCGIATMTVGSIIKGVLEIYGTTNILTSVYTPLGIALLLIGATLYLTSLANKAE